MIRREGLLLLILNYLLRKCFNIGSVTFGVFVADLGASLSCCEFSGGNSFGSGINDPHGWSLVLDPKLISS